jgi:hypothetical protein
MSKKSRHKNNLGAQGAQGKPVPKQNAGGAALIDLFSIGAANNNQNNNSKPAGGGGRPAGEAAGSDTRLNNGDMFEHRDRPNNKDQYKNLKKGGK